MFDHLKNKKLYRSPKDSLIFGVCSGLANFFQVDVVLVRLGVIALAVFFHFWPAAVLYVVAMFLMPIDPMQDTVPTNQQPKDVTPAEPKPKSEPEPTGEAQESRESQESHQ